MLLTYTIKKVLTNRKRKSSYPENEMNNQSVVRSISSVEPFFVNKMPSWKRTMDIICTILGLIFFSPLLLLISLLIKILSPGPILFKQERVGFGGKSFQFLKFRTMKLNADETKHQQYYAQLINSSSKNVKSEEIMTKLDDSNDEILPFGRILRNTGLDELPQLVNVLCGDMSLVGPRPPILYEVEEYLRWHNGRFDSVPGITGLWQVSGKNRLTFREMVRLDIRYSRQLSFWLDLKILLMTPTAIFSQIMDSIKIEKR